MKLTKQAINRSLDIAGMRESLMAALEFNVQIETSETAESREFNAILKRDGAKAAIAWRSARAAGADTGSPDVSKATTTERAERAPRALPRHPATGTAGSPTCSASCAASAWRANEFAKPFGKGVNFCGATVLLDAKGQTFEGIDNGGRDGDPDAIATRGARHAGARAVGRGSDRAGAHADGEAGRLALVHRSPPGAAQGRPATARSSASPPWPPPSSSSIYWRGTASSPRRGSPTSPAPRQPQDGPQYGVMEDIEEVDKFMAELFDVCAAQNIPAGATLKEFSPGQFEVNLQHVASAERACDHAVLLKRAVKAVARRHGMHASFMAKPFAEWAGCSLHVHVSLVDRDGRNVFTGKGKDPFSETFRHAVGGLAATDGRIDGHLRAHREFLPALPSQHVRAAGAQLGLQPPWRFTAHADLGARGHAHRASPGRRRRQSLPRAGLHSRRPAPRHRRTSSIRARW